MTAVLADTGPLYAAAVPSDQHHARARKELERLVSGQLALIVCCPILLETYTLLLRRVRPSEAHAWLRELTAGASLVNASQEEYLEAARGLRGYPDQPITLFDSVLAVLGERLGHPTWTYDHRFDVMRSAVWR